MGKFTPVPQLQKNSNANIAPSKCNIERMRSMLPRVGVTYGRVLDWRIGFVAPYIFTQFGTTTDNTAHSLLYTLYSSWLHTH
jgi:hypothetical protein